MAVKYIVDGQEFFTVSQVRAYLGNRRPNSVLFGNPPTENEAEFWTQLGVTYQLYDVDPQPQPERTLDEAKAQKLSELDSAYTKWRTEDAYITSSLGFRADSDERANTDVGGLVIAQERKDAATRTVEYFRDYDNEIHPLNLEQLKTIQVEIINECKRTYDVKWSLEKQIKEATTVEDVDSIVIQFEPEEA